MNIPYRYRFASWLKDNSVALVTSNEGKKLVIKEYQWAGTLSELSVKAKTYSKTLRQIMPEFSEVEKYLVRSYIQGAMAGDTAKTFGFTNEALEKIDPQVIAASLYELNFFAQADFIVQAKLEVRGAAWYLRNIEETKAAVSAQLGKDFYLQMVSYLQNNFRKVDSCTNFLINGDLHPQNFFYNCLYSGEAKDFMITDWDLLHINNPGFDLSVICSWTWRNREWTNKFITAFTSYYQDKRDELALCLSFCQVYLSAQMLKHVSLIDEINLNGEEKTAREGLRGSSLETLKKIIK